MAGVLQEYITGLPLGNLITPRELAIITAVLFTLAFWLHDIGGRVDRRDQC